MKCVDVITGGAGFIGANLASRLVREGRSVVILDNLSAGRLEFLGAVGSAERVQFMRVDMAERDQVLDAFAEILSVQAVGDVWHLCANSNIQAGTADPDIDLRNTFLSTYNLLIAMRKFELPTLHFASTSAVYGDHGEQMIAETAATRPISNYGAMKLASEAQISAAAEAFLRRADIYRFPNVVGTPATHGVIVDFIAKLTQTPRRLDVLGDGTQRKCYLHVNDLIDAMVHIGSRSLTGVTIINIGPNDSGVTVRSIAETVRDLISPDAELIFGEGNKGWAGDVPRFHYSLEKLTALGFQSTRGSREAVQQAAREIAVQMGVL
jgi:UDP-glucose 4-epimerase